MRRPRSRLVVAPVVAFVVVSIVATFLPGAAPAGATTPTAGHRWLIVGDSLCVGTRAMLTASHSSCTIADSTRDALADLAAIDDVPADVVVELGTNPSPVADIATIVRRLRVLGAQRIWWVTAHSRRADYRSWNVALHRNARSLGFALIDWATYAASAPGLYAGDGIHHTETGKQRFAAAINRAVAAAGVAPAFDDPIGPGARTARHVVGRLYHALLGRRPDADGWRRWTEALERGGLSPVGLTEAFLASGEFQARAAGLDAAGLVSVLHHQALGRDPGGDELAAWAAALSDAAGRASTILRFSESAEHQLRAAPLVTSGTVGRLYRITLGRGPDPIGAYTWSSFLDAGHDATELADALLASAEHGGRFAALTDRELVERLYLAALGVEPSAARADTWVARLRAGRTRSEVIVAFAGSDAAIRHLGDGWASPER